MPSAKDDFKDDIEAYCERLRKGTTVREFLEGFKRIILQPQWKDLAPSYRLGKKESGIDLKKLRDEVSPVARFVEKHAQPYDKISFRLDNGFPDGTVCHQDGLRREIEVTLARGLARFHWMTKLNESGEARGLIELQNGASEADITAAKTQQPKMYSTDDAINSVVRAVEMGARRKEQHQGHTLLIEVVPDMRALPKDRWLCLRRQLVGNAIIRALRFCEVYVTGICDGGDLVLRIK